MTSLLTKALPAILFTLGERLAPAIYAAPSNRPVRRRGFESPTIAATFLASGLTLLPQPSLLAAEYHRPVAIEAHIEKAPLTIAASTVGHFAEGQSWHLSVNSVGQAELTLMTYPTRKSVRFTLDPKQMVEFRRALVAERFFEMRGGYGRDVPSGGERTLTVSAGHLTNTVKVRHLSYLLQADQVDLLEAKRVVRLLIVVRGWFDHAQAVDLRKHDQRLLDAASRE